MNTQESIEAYCLHMADRAICLPKEDLMCLASRHDIQNVETSHYGNLTALAFAGSYYPIYHLREDLIPGAGQGREESLVVLLANDNAISSSSKSLKMAISCRAISKVSLPSRPIPIPSFMAKGGPMEALTWLPESLNINGKSLLGATQEQNQKWVFFTSADRLIQFFEGALSYAQRTAEHVRMAS